MNWTDEQWGLKGDKDWAEFEKRVAELGHCAGVTTPEELAQKATERFRELGWVWTLTEEAKGHCARAADAQGRLLIVGRGRTPVLALLAVLGSWPVRSGSAAVPEACRWHPRGHLEPCRLLGRVLDGYRVKFNSDETGIVLVAGQYMGSGIQLKHCPFCAEGIKSE